MQQRTLIGLMVGFVVLLAAVQAFASTGTGIDAPIETGKLMIMKVVTFLFILGCAYAGFQVYQREFGAVFQSLAYVFLSGGIAAGGIVFMELTGIVEGATLAGYFLTDGGF